MVTISDYVAMRLCESNDAVIARDMAASWGGYDLEIGDFCRKSWRHLAWSFPVCPGFFLATAS